MIHELLQLHRPFFVLDTETTGVNPEVDRIIELGFQEWGPEGMKREWRALIDPGVPIPASATKVHGITNATMRSCRHCGHEEVAHINSDCEGYAPALKFAQLAQNLAKGLSDCDFGGQNIRFDLRMIAAEMGRAKVGWDYAKANIVDTYAIEQILQPRNLSALHAKYTGAPHDGAHGALSDVRAATTVLAHQLQQHPNLPRNLEALHKMQWPGWIDGDGKFKFVDGVACFGNWGKYKNQPMSKADSGYWDFILANNFPDDVKKLAADAKLKKFPTRD